MLCKSQTSKSRNCSQNATALHVTNTVRRSSGKNDNQPDWPSQSTNERDQSAQNYETSTNIYNKTRVQRVKFLRAVGKRSNRNCCGNKAIVKSRNLHSKLLKSGDFVTMHKFKCCQKCIVFTKSKNHIYSPVFIN